VTVKRAIKKLLSLAGLDLRRFDPAEGNFGWLEPFSIRSVIDVGANAGLFAAEFRRALPEANLYAFEPLADRCELMRRRFAKDPRFEAFCCALGDADSVVSMHRSEFSFSSSLLPMGQLHKDLFPHTRNCRPETVTVRTLDGAMAGRDLAENLLVKIDVQGTEDRVIRGGLRTVARAAVVITETSFVELYEGQSLFGVVYDLLRDLGFQYAGAWGPQRRNRADGRVLQSDSIFIRPDLRRAGHV
jgi:FkbM family methyltransferase